MVGVQLNGIVCDLKTFVVFLPYLRISHLKWAFLVQSHCLLGENHSGICCFGSLLGAVTTASRKAFRPQLVSYASFTPM